MRVLDRYLWKQVISGSLIVLIALVGIAALLSFIHQLSKIDSISELGHVFYFTALELPVSIYELLPISVLTGSLMSLGALGTQSELIAARALGYSRKDIVASALKAGVVFMLLMGIIGEFVTPVTETAMGRLEQQKSTSFDAIDYNLWIRDGRNFIYAKRLKGERYEGITVYEYDAEYEKLLAITHADSMVVKEDQFILYGLRVAQLNDEQINLLVLDSKIIKRKVRTKGTVLRAIKPKALNSWQLYAHIDFLKQNQLRSDIHELEAWKRVSNILSILAMLLVAVPFIFMKNRESSAGLKFFAGLVIGLVYIILDRVINGLAIVFEWPLWFGAFATLLFFTLIGVFRLREHRIVSPLR